MTSKPRYVPNRHVCAPLHPYWEPNNTGAFPNCATFQNFCWLWTLKTCRGASHGPILSQNPLGHVFHSVEDGALGRGQMEGLAQTSSRCRAGFRSFGSGSDWGNHTERCAEYKTPLTLKQNALLLTRDVTISKSHDTIISQYSMIFIALFKKKKDKWRLGKKGKFHAF